VVAETEKERFNPLSSRCLTIVVFPAPDGADIITSLPFISFSVNGSNGLRPEGQIASKKS
jgi:hypothetical protein